MTNREIIEQAKRKSSILIAAHTYQPPAVQQHADVLGDSFFMAQSAAESCAETVYVCGVRFMAEGIKLLAPDKKVVLVSPDADCPMAHQIEPQRVTEFKAANPGAAVVVYINSDIRLKAVSDVCVTSSCAVEVVKKQIGRASCRERV